MRDDPHIGRIIGTIDALVAKIDEQIDAEIEAAIGLIPERFVVRVREGGGSESKIGTLCISICKMREALK